MKQHIFYSTNIKFIEFFLKDKIGFGNYAPGDHYIDDLSFNNNNPLTAYVIYVHSRDIIESMIKEELRTNHFHFISTQGSIISFNYFIKEPI